MSKYIVNRPELFNSDCIFGTNIWEFHAELWSCQNDLAVRILVYETLIDNSPQYQNHLPHIADFLKIEVSNIKLSDTSFLVSRDQMLRHVDKFDNQFITEQGKKTGQALRIMKPAAKE